MMRIVRIDKSDGSEHDVNDIEQAVERIAGHLGIAESAVYEAINVDGRIQTNFNIYEKREG